VVVIGLLLAIAYLNLLRLARETIDDRLPGPSRPLPEPGGQYVSHTGITATRPDK
jgi:hypothetical protein